jgi:hypothetical protein
MRFADSAHPTTARTAVGSEPVLGVSHAQAFLRRSGRDGRSLGPREWMDRARPTRSASRLRPGPSRADGLSWHAFWLAGLYPPGATDALRGLSASYDGYDGGRLRAGAGRLARPSLPPSFRQGRPGPRAIGWVRLAQPGVPRLHGPGRQGRTTCHGMRFGLPGCTRLGGPMRFADSAHPTTAAVESGACCTWMARGGAGPGGIRMPLIAADEGHGGLKRGR